MSESAISSDAQSASIHDSVLQVNVCGKYITLHRATNLEALWDSMVDNMCQRHDKRKTVLASGVAHVDAFENDERLPYWTELWPSSVVLAEWIYSQKKHISQKKCLDLGCGLGLTALVGHMCGARVVAMDYEEEALRFAQQSTKVNAEKGLFGRTDFRPLWTLMDWRAPAIQRGSIDVLWGGDIMYERSFVQPVLRFMEYALNKQGKAWIAEPCRSVYEHFQAELYARRWHARLVYESCVEALYAQTIPVSVNIWELTLGDNL